MTQPSVDALAESDSKIDCVIDQNSYTLSTSISGISIDLDGTFTVDTSTIKP